MSFFQQRRLWPSWLDMRSKWETIASFCTNTTQFQKRNRHSSWTGSTGRQRSGSYGPYCRTTTLMREETGKQRLLSLSPYNLCCCGYKIWWVFQDSRGGFLAYQTPLRFDSITFLIFWFPTPPMFLTLFISRVTCIMLWKSESVKRVTRWKGKRARSTSSARSVSSASWIWHWMWCWRWCCTLSLFHSFGDCKSMRVQEGAKAML